MKKLNQLSKDDLRFSFHLMSVMVLLLLILFAIQSIRLHNMGSNLKSCESSEAKAEGATIEVFKNVLAYKEQVIESLQQDNSIIKFRLDNSRAISQALEQDNVRLLSILKNESRSCIQ